MSRLRSAVIDAIVALGKVRHGDEPNGCMTCCIVEDLKTALEEDAAGRRVWQAMSDAERDYAAKPALLEHQSLPLRGE